ncbi:MAG: lysoplasmalogenase [Candidatus Hydrogenedentes bacterium]|nr:lysoplasmalogenase [Candidatus Hydrogenedentota bacterium]
MNLLIISAIMVYGGLIPKLVTEGFGWPGKVPSKMVASTGFILAALASGALNTTYGRIVLIGLAFCWIGDLLLEYDRAFLPGLVTFLLAHVAFIAGFATLGPRLSWAVAAAALAALAAAAVAVYLHPHVPRAMRLPVYAYMAVISTMVVLATAATGARHTPAILAGAVLFYVSDLFVARRQFVTHSFKDTLYGNPLYFTAVWLIALTPGLI